MFYVDRYWKFLSAPTAHKTLDIIHEITINAIFYARNHNYNEFIDRAISANSEINKIIKK